MQLLHASRSQCKILLSPSFRQRLPLMIRAIEQEWSTQISHGAYPFHQRQYLKQAHIALATLLEIQGEVAP